MFFAPGNIFDVRLGAQNRFRTIRQWLFWIKGAGGYWMAPDQPRFGSIARPCPDAPGSHAALQGYRERWCFGDVFAPGD